CRPSPITTRSFSTSPSGRAGGTFPDESVFIDSRAATFLLIESISERSTCLPSPTFPLMPYFKTFSSSDQTGAASIRLPSRKYTVHTSHPPCANAVISQKKTRQNVAITIGILFESIMKHLPDVMTKHTDFSY